MKNRLHVKAPGNWVNDPNGMIYYKGQYHLFYQHFPYAPRWGTMHWGHAVSPDLIHWEHVGVALFPSLSEDQNGCFSGSAVEENGVMHLFYTGVHYNQVNPKDIHQCLDQDFTSAQLHLTSKDGMHFDVFGDKEVVIPALTDPEIGDKYTTLYPDLYAEKYDGEFEDSKNTVYLTFDDGPSVLTENLLYYLRQENVKATFFVVPERTEYCYSLLKEISDAGHTIGIHSASHDYEKIYASVDAFLADFKEAYDIVLEATGKAPDIYRFPGGSVNDYNTDTRDDIIAEMARRGFTYFDWNVDSNDWQGYGWTTLYTNVLADAQEFSTPVILFHNTGDRDNTVLVIEDIIKALKDKGYKFGSLSHKTEPIQFQ